MSTFYFVRHAHAGWTPDENRPLSAQGLQDAGRVAAALCEFPIAAIYSSPARRACQTIKPLAAQLNLAVHLEPDLQERRLGEGKFKDFLRAVEATWKDPSFAHPGGEANTAAQKRGVGVVQRLLKKADSDHIVLSTHGNLMALTLQAFDPKVDFTFWRSLTMPDIYRLKIEPSGRGSIHRMWMNEG